MKFFFKKPVLIILFVVILGQLTTLSVISAVTLLYFRAEPGDRKVFLKWDTASEINTLGFLIYRRIDGGHYDPITSTAIIIAKTIDEDQSNDYLPYQVTDTNITNGIKYWYKLVEVDSGNNLIDLEEVSVIPGGSIQQPTPTATQTQSQATANPSKTPKAKPTKITPTKTITRMSSVIVRATNPPLNLYPTNTPIPSENSRPQDDSLVVSQKVATPTLEPLPSLTLVFARPNVSEIIETPTPPVNANQAKSGSSWISKKGLAIISLLVVIWLGLGGWFFLSFRLDKWNNVFMPTMHPIPTSKRWWVLLGLSVIILMTIGGIWVRINTQKEKSQNTNLDDRLNYPPAVKVYTSKEGVFEIHRSDLIKIGIRENQLNLDEVNLYQKGLKLPLWIDRNKDDFTIRFYAQESNSLYTAENIYWLSFNSEELKQNHWQAAEAIQSGNADFNFEYNRMVELPGGSYLGRIFLEKNLIYQPIVKAGDHWFWETLAAPGSASYEFELTSVSNGKAILTISLWSGTESSHSPDHHISLSVNDIQVSDEYWDGTGEHTIEALIPSGTLREGKNVIVITAPGLEGVIADIINLNWMSIDYPRRPQAIDDQLKFTSPKDQLILSGFSGDVSVYDITNPNAAVLAADSIKKSEAGIVFTGEKDRLYLAVGLHGYQKPDSLKLTKFDLDLTSQANSASYIMISPLDFKEALQPLIDWRNKEGYKALFIPVEDIYDQFNNGYPEPIAIQRFINYAKGHWKLPPNYILLVGDASYDPRGYLAQQQTNQLPTFFIQTVYGGQTASDVLFTTREFTESQKLEAPIELLNDIYLGRVPAQRADQVVSFVNKTLDYEKWQNQANNPVSILAVADGQGDNFKEDARGFLNLFPKELRKELYAPPPGIVNGNKQTVDDINDGYSLVAYFGHGSINMWGKDRLFTTEDVPSLSNIEHLPVVINMTCLTGLFTHPKTESLTESLLWYPKGGAVAVLAPTSLTLPFDQSYLSRSLAENYLSHPEYTLGQILQEARLSLPIKGERQNTTDVMLTFLLFGDPALKLPHP